MKKIVLFFLMMLSFNVSVMAAHLDLKRIDGVYSSQLNLDTGEYFSYRQNKYLMDGMVVYCVEPGIDIMTRDYSVSSNLSDSGLSQSVLDRIVLIGHFGYDYPTHKSDKYFLAAQELIWESLGDYEVHFTTGQYDTGDMIDIYNEKKEILSLVNQYSLKPSFDGEYVSGLYGDRLVLTDKNRVLSGYDVVSSSNNVYIDGNDLIVDISNVGVDDIRLVRKSYDNSNSIFYYDFNSQDFMFLRASGNISSSVSVNGYVPYSNISINKTGLVLDSVDSFNNFVYKEDGLSDVQFNLYAGSDIYAGGNLVYHSDDLIEELETHDGRAISRNLPNGSYYLKEVSTQDGFVLLDGVIPVELENYKEEVYTYMLDLSNDRKNVFINLTKYGEVFSGIVDEHGSFEVVPFGGIRFGLYNSDDIFNSSGELVFSKDTLIKTFVTDGTGSINEKVDIPIGNYYLKELETRDGYELDTNIYSFSLSDHDVENNFDILIGFDGLINHIFKGSLIINKVNSDGNGLEGACFRVFDDFNNIIYEGCTDSSGVLKLNDLGYGRYHFYEVSAPTGYVVSDQVNEVNISSDGAVVSVSVVNDKMPVTSDTNRFHNMLSILCLTFGVSGFSLALVYDKKNKDN